MECQYCFKAFDLEFHKPLHMQRVTSSINAPICEYCKKYMIKHNVDNIMIRNQRVNIRELNDNIPTINKLKTYCKSHNKMVKSICADHYEFFCSECNHHRMCKTDELGDDTIEKGLDNKILSTFKIDNRAILSEVLKINTDQEIPDHFHELMVKLQKDYEVIQNNCDLALKSKSIEEKKQALQMAAAVKDIKIDKLKSYNEFFRRVLFGPPKRPKQPVPSMIPGMGSGHRADSGTEDEFEEPVHEKPPIPFEPGKDPDISRVFDQLKQEFKPVIRLFTQKKVSSVRNFTESLIIRQDLYDSFPVLGIGFATCTTLDCLVIKSLYVTNEISFITMNNCVVQRRLNSVVSEVNLPEPLLYERNMNLRIELEIEAEGDYYTFMDIGNNQGVEIQGYDHFPYDPSRPSLILYIF